MKNTAHTNTTQEQIRIASAPYREQIAQLQDKVNALESTLAILREIDARPFQIAYRGHLWTAKPWDMVMGLLNDVRDLEKQLYPVRENQA